MQRLFQALQIESLAPTVTAQFRAVFVSPCYRCPDECELTAPARRHSMRRPGPAVQSRAGTAQSPPRFIPLSRSSPPMDPEASDYGTIIMWSLLLIGLIV